MKITIEVRIDGESPYRWDFEGSSFQVGRSPESDLQIQLESQQMVSWGHLQAVEDTKGGVYVTDLASTNGSFLNGQRLEDSQSLKPDDEISLGETGPKLKVVQLQTIADEAFAATYVENRSPGPQLLADEIAVTGQMMITPDPTLPFGKYKGKTLESCPSSYLKWVADHLRDSETHEWAVKAQQVYERRQQQEKTGSGDSPPGPAKKAPADEWYYDEGGNPAGPVSLEALRGMISRGALLPKVSVWQEGMDHWVVAAILPGLVDEQLDEPLDEVPPPALAQTQFLDSPADVRSHQQIIDHRTKALVALVVNPFFGGLALFFSLRVKKKSASGDMAAAQADSRLAELWSTVAFGMTLVIGGLLAIFAMMAKMSE